MKKLVPSLIACFLLSASLAARSQGYFSFGYGPFFPLGPDRGFIPETGWRSISAEAGVFTGRNFCLGVAFSWYGSYKAYPYQTYANVQGSTVTVTGLQWRYGNQYPLTAVARYYIPIGNSRFRPFAGVGAGPWFVNRTLDFGIYSKSQYATQFGFYPELGCSLWIKSGVALNLGARYNYSFRAKDIPGQSNVAVNIGLLWKIGASEDFAGKAP